MKILKSVEVRTDDGRLVSNIKQRDRDRDRETDRCLVCLAKMSGMIAERAGKGEGERERRDAQRGAPRKTSSGFSLYLVAHVHVLIYSCLLKNASLLLEK